MFGQLPLAAAMLALSFAEGPAYNGFIIAAVRGKLYLPMRLNQGVSMWAKVLLELNSESIVMMRRRVLKGHLFLLFSPVQHPTFGLRRLSAACLYSVPGLPFPCEAKYEQCDYMALQ